MPRYRSPAQRAAIERSQTARRLARRSGDIPGLSDPAAQRKQGDVLAGDFRLTELARLRHPAARWWWGERRGGDGVGAYCYLCDRYIASYDTRYPMTDRAADAVLEHRDRAHRSGAPSPGPTDSDRSAGA